MAEPLFVGVDLGTSSVKVVTLDATGSVQHAGSARYDVATPHPGWTETSPAAWWDAVVVACRSLPQDDRDRCTGIGLSGQMHGVVLVDDDVAPLRPALLHADTRAVDQLDRYRALAPDLLARLANPLSPNMAGPMLLWLADHEPERLGRARWALQPKDWIRWRLTGAVASEPSDASATLLYDATRCTWADDVVVALGLPRTLLPPLLDRSDATAGQLDPRAAAELGLPPGIPVAAGGGDTAVAALGSGLLASGATQLTVGTGGQVVAPLTAAQVAALAAPGSPPRTTQVHRDVADAWYALAAVLSAGLALDWVRRSLAATWDELYATAAIPPTPEAPVFVPHLTGERTPYLDPGLRASWSGLQLSHTRDDLLRAALEGVAFTLRDALDALPDDGGGALWLAGGGTRSEPWRQLLADVMERPLHPAAVRDSSARGAAILGAIAAGHIDPGRMPAAWFPDPGPATSPRPALAAVTTGRRTRYAHAVAALRG